MFENTFYNQHIRKLVSVFGTLFNDIHVQRTDKDGNILERNKVPLAYGPKQKFIARINEQANLSDPKMAIKLPRMSFEIMDISYDTTAKLNKQIRDAYPHSTDSYKANQYAADYEEMYRLRWSSHPMRLFVFRCVKAVYTKLLDLYRCTVKVIREKINLKR